MNRRERTETARERDDRPANAPKVEPAGEVKGQTANESKGAAGWKAGWPEEELLRRLDELKLAARAIARATMPGRRRSRQLGASLDFADYRLYSPGDDIRQLDWNAYGRTGKPFVKLFLDEQELMVHLWIDASKSMDFGKKTDGATFHKFDYARHLAACIGYVALAGYDRVTARFFTDRVTAEEGPLRGKGSAARLFRFLSEGSVQAAGNLDRAVMQPASAPRFPGMTWVFSDFLYESGVEQALGYLLAARQEVIAVHILEPGELNPQLSGELRLIDSESGSGREVAVSERVLEEYRGAVRRYTAQLRQLCAERGIRYVLAVTGTPVMETVAALLRSLAPR